MTKKNSSSKEEKTVEVEEKQEPETKTCDFEDEVQEEVIEDDSRIEDLMIQLTRLQADFKNYKMRSEKERGELVSFGIKRLSNELLPVIDNFERALKEDVGKEDAFYQGISLIYDQLMTVLADNKIKPMDSLGEPFDPEKHHAVFLEEVEGIELDCVSEVLQKGYLFEDQVLRPAMVKVCK
ncbi:MAG: nucleotide exchange factor GrpE [Tissierellia bacterium]|nr:nucleotide exchange factor GrpE [Tissierellia bacterium]